MSELKAFDVGLGQYTEDGSPCVVAFDADQNPRLLGNEKVYLKSEADKVLAHNKHKRCLAMAKSCKNCAEMFGCMASHERLKFGKTPYYQKCSLHANIQICHEKKWLELAEKFKPNNSTAQ